MRVLGLFALFFLTCSPIGASADSVKQAAIVIIIDDLGNNLPLGMRAINLPGPITYAVLPHRPHSAKLATAAHHSGKEVMLHMPMENTQGYNIGAGGLTSQLDHNAFEHQVNRAINSVPFIQGVNNHMGSSLTQDPGKMSWLMGLLQKYPLYFVDSRTSSNSVAGNIAVGKNIPSLDRDVFLDHDDDPKAIAFQFRRLLQIARKQGTAVAIGHPYMSTLGYLENVLPKLDGLGIKLVSPSGLLLIKNQQAAQDTQPQTVTAALPNEADRCRIIEQVDVTRVSCT
jgi:hypothetical protein